MVVELGPLAGLKRSGIYAVSVPCVKAPKITKIGKAKDLRARIDQYQLYYPFGVAIELLWIFPKNTRNVDTLLKKMERLIQELLDPVHTITRRKQTEWFWNEKKEVAEAFLKGTELFPNGLLVNPAFHFSVVDLSDQEKKKNEKARKDMAQMSLAQSTFIRKNFPRDYAFLRSCRNWKSDPKQRFRNPR